MLYPYTIDGYSTWYNICSTWYLDNITTTCLHRSVIKPGAPGFLKLICVDRQYVCVFACVCVCVRPEAVNN